MNNQTISVIVPFLNEEENLPILYQRIISVFENINEQLELVFIDDGSNDQSLKWVKLIAAENSNVKYIKLSRNFGHQRNHSRYESLHRGCSNNYRCRSARSTRSDKRSN